MARVQRQRGLAAARSDGGQGTIEYLGVVALVITAVAVGMTATAAPTYLNATVGGFRKALCTVTGRDCRSLDEHPCVVRARTDGRTLTANLAVVRLRDGRTVVQERLSDGTIRVTVTRANAVGAEVGVGVGAKVDVGGVALDASLQANAALHGLFGAGKAYVVVDAGAAQRLIKEIEGGHARPPDITFAEGGVRGEAEARGGVEASIGLGRAREPSAEVGDGVRSEPGREDATKAAGKLEAPSSLTLAEAGVTAKVAGARALGRRVDRRTGETTWYLRADQEATAEVAVSALGRDGVRADALVTADGVLALTTDRDGRPVEVGVVGTYRTAVTYGTAAGQSGTAGGRRHEISVLADPDDPQIAAALRAWRNDPAEGAALVDLTRSVYRAGRVDRRTYDVSHDGDSVGGSVALGVKIGGGYETQNDRATLLSASTRPPGGVWEQRRDCVEQPSS